MSATDVIFRSVPDDDMLMAFAALRWLQARPDNNDAIIAYGKAPYEKKFYVVRRKASIVVRPI